MVTKLMCWKKVVNQKGNIWWQVGINKSNPLHLHEKWIHIEEHTPYIKKEFGDKWQVRTPTRINKKTIYGKTRNFKSKSQALQFAKSYMKKHDKC